MFEKTQKNNNSEKGCQNAKKRSNIGWGCSQIQRLKFGSIYWIGGSPDWQRKFNLRKKNPRSDVYGLN